MKHLGDLTKINGATIQPVDVITFGSPCQNLSIAGNREGLAGAESGLFMEAVRIIKEMRNACELRNIGRRNSEMGNRENTNYESREAGIYSECNKCGSRAYGDSCMLCGGHTGGTYPRYAVWENVPGAYSSNKGEDFRAVLEELCRVKDETAAIPQPDKGKWLTAGEIVGADYSIAWRTLDAQYWGVPQRRRRIFLVADFGGQSASEVLFKREGLSRHTAQGGEEGQGTPRGAAVGIGTTGEPLILQNNLYQAGIDTNGICFTLCEAAGAGGGHVPMITQPLAMGFDRYNGVDTGGISQSLAGVSRLNNVPHVCEPIAFAQNQREEVRDLNGISGALAAEQGMHQQTFVCEPITAGFNGHKSITGNICYNEELSPCLETKMPANVLEPITVDFGRTADRITIDPIVSVTLQGEGGGMGAKTGLYCLQTVEALPFNTTQITSPKNGNNPKWGDPCHTLAATDHAPAICLQGSMIGRADHNGPQGDGINEDVSFTLNTTDRHAVAVRTGQTGANGIGVADNVAYTLDGANGQAIAFGEADFHNYKEDRVSALKASGGCLGGGSETFIVNTQYAVRRLTPLECERLQGFPDLWTDITYKGKPASDSARYKALGNSVAIPCVEYAAEGIAQFIPNGIGGSLFDGIGGFPLALGRYGINFVWASEVDMFCIDVTNYRFGGEQQ